MGTSNLDQFVLNTPDSDVHSPKLSNLIQDHQCNSLSSTPTLNALENDHSSQENEINIKGDENSAFCALKIHIRTCTEELKVSNDSNDPKTPTSKAHRIPITKTCPPAPRKTRRVTTNNGKRKAAYFPDIRVPADFMVYVDAMLALNEAIYVPDIVVGDLGEGDNAKRLKPLSSPAHEL